MTDSFRFSPLEVYSVVADTEKYREFVPWCLDSVLIEKRVINLKFEIVVL